MTIAIFFFVFFVSANAHCGTSTCQANQNQPYQRSHTESYRQNPDPDPYYNMDVEQYKALEQMRDDGTSNMHTNQPSSATGAQSRSRCNPGDMIANDADCTSYYACINGQYELQLCQSGNFFDPSAKCCRSDYVCPNRAQDQPAAQASTTCSYGEMRADESSCRHYYLCVGYDRHFERRICPDDMTFDRRLNRCAHGNTENTCAQQQFSTGAYESRGVGVGLACTESSGPSGYSADPTDCRRYYQCAQGRWVRMNCPSNLVWNPAATTCDWPKNTLLSCH